MNRWQRAWRLLRRLLLTLCLGWLLLRGGEWLLDGALPYPQERLAALEHSTVVTAADGSWLQVWPTQRGERAILVHWQDLSVPLQAAILLAEDERFFDHTGVDFAAGLRALGQNLAAGRVVSGASTLTMQAVRIVEPRPRTLLAKVIEAFRARQLERLIGKPGVLDLWASQVPMGGTLRGMEAAARHWFGTAASQLDAVEAATLVAMVPAPSARAPHRRPELLRDRRNALLARLAAAAVLPVAELAAAQARPLGTVRHLFPQRAWHLCQAALAAATGVARPAVLTTAVDPGMQFRLEALLPTLNGLPGDGCAVVVLSRQNGALQALVGDRLARPGTLDLSRCRRSVGSTLKPFLYALAREQGVLTDAGLVDDSPIDLAGWHPANFDGSYIGHGRAADALAASANLPAVRTLQQTGLPAFAAVLQGLGMQVDPHGLGLDAALGTVAASPLELARAWQRFVAEPARVGLGAAAVAWTLAALSVLPLPRPGAVAGGVAWKSGTSSGRRDAWCVGVTERQVVVVWLGNRTGRGAADLVGAHSAAGLLADVIALL